MLKRIVALAVLAAAAGCAPMVTHAPRVERGLYMVGTAGVPASLCDTSCDLELIPQVGLGFRYGWPAEGRRVGFSVGATFSAPITSSDVDVYVQAPTGSSPWAAGAGVLIGGEHVMPYVQLGNLGPGGSGWYTTHGFALLRTRNEEIEFLTDGTEHVRPRYWSPTVAYRRGRPGGAFQLYVSAALGWSDRIQGRWSESPTVVGREPVRSVMIGITLEERMLAPIPIIGWPR